MNYPSSEGDGAAGVWMTGAAGAWMMAARVTWAGVWTRVRE